MEKISEEEFKNIILDGLATDVFIAERAYTMFKIIGDNASVIQSVRGYSELFKSMQSAFKDQFLLAAARLFDPKSTRNRVRSVFEVLGFLSKNSSRLPAIRQWPNLFRVMKDIKFDEETMHLIESKRHEQEIAMKIVHHFESLLQSNDTKRFLESLKDIRDKKLAHNEYKLSNAELIEAIDPVTFKDFYSLIEIAKNLIGVVGWAYMNYVFKHNGQYHLTKDAHRLSIPLQKLIRQISGIERLE